VICRRLLLVNHKILLDKLKFYGIEGKFKTLIKSYLTDRQQRAVLGNIIDSNNTSKWATIKCRVPQGSILGSVFYILINYLPKILNKDNTSMVLYADDSSVMITDTNKLHFKMDFNQTFRKLSIWNFSPCIIVTVRLRLIMIRKYNQCDTN
jgi:hypothetical protein